MPPEDITLKKRTEIPYLFGSVETGIGYLLFFPTEEAES